MSHNLWINKYWSFIYLWKPMDSRHHYSSVILQDRHLKRWHNSDRMIEILFDHRIHMLHCSWTSHSKLKTLNRKFSIQLNWLIYNDMTHYKIFFPRKRIIPWPTASLILCRKFSKFYFKKFSVLMSHNSSFFINCAK